METPKKHTWKNCCVSFKEGHSPEPVDFHSHSFYEVSLILSGNVKTLLRNRSEEGTQCRLVLSAPETPHLVFLSKPSHYARLNLYFEPEFIANSVIEWPSLSQVFGKQGNIIMLSPEERQFCQARLQDIMTEDNLFRKKLRILALLSYIAEFDKSLSKTSPIPHYVVDAVTYINGHYNERIVASELADVLKVGRTTLMTSIKKYTGLTLSEYILRVRIKKAIQLLQKGMSQEVVAEETGFCNGSGIVRAFRRCYGMTPGQYMKNQL